MRLRKHAHHKSTTAKKQYRPFNMLLDLNKDLSKRYNHSDKYYYLQKLHGATKSRATSTFVRIKDLETLDAPKETLQKYINRLAFSSYFSQVINYYKYYQDIPRNFIKGFEAIIIKNVEAQRLRRYNGLRHLVEEPKQEVQVVQNYSEFMPLLKSFDKKIVDQQNSLLSLKNDLSLILQDKSWVKGTSSICLPSYFFCDLNQSKWNRFSQNNLLFKIHRSKQSKRTWTSIEHLNIKTENGNQVLKQRLHKKPLTRMKTLNTGECGYNKILPLYEASTFRRSDCHNTRDKSTYKVYIDNNHKSESKSPPKPMLFTKHNRMRSQPFSKQKYINSHLNYALQMYKTSQVSKFKRKRKDSEKVLRTLDMRSMRI